jgi:hypothetical protein
MTTELPTQASLIDALQSDLERFRIIVTHLDDEEQQVPFTPEDWSVKDFLAHMAHWKAATHSLLVAYLHNQPLPPVTPSGDEANEQDRQANSLLPLPQVRTYWEEVHERLQHLVVDDLDDKTLAEVVRVPWDANDTEPIALIVASMCNHDAEHFDLIEQYFEVTE